MKPLLSIVVPTKDRYKYLKHLIALIDSFNSSEIELVLQDNTADNIEILKFIKQKEYPFIKYAHNVEQLPISYNSDLAILNSSGEYVCFIGDDDGVTKHIIDCVHWMKWNDIDAIVPAVVHYLWADYPYKLFGKHDSVLYYERFTNKIELVNIHNALNKSLNEGFVHRGIIPSVYQGIVKRDVLDKIYIRGGTYFPGPSPDMANGVALCFVAKKYARIDFPIIISGASAGRGAGTLSLKDRSAKIEDAPFLPKNAKATWEENIPKIFAGETVWPESAIKALRYMGHADIIKQVNFEYIQAKFIMGHLDYWRESFKVTDNHLKLIYKLIEICLIRIEKAILRRIKNLSAINNFSTVQCEIKDIQGAQNFLLKQYPSFDIK